jgi:hypothetical protein
MCTHFESLIHCYCSFGTFFVFSSLSAKRSLSLSSLCAAHNLQYPKNRQERHQDKLFCFHFSDFLEQLSIRWKLSALENRLTPYLPSAIGNITRKVNHFPFQVGYAHQFIKPNAPLNAPTLINRFL